MSKPSIQGYTQLAEILIQKYERYLPTAFDPSLSLLEKVNKVIEYLNQIGKLTNDIVLKWNEVMEWLMGEGLESAVDELFQEWLNDGTWESLINHQVLGTKADQITVNVDRFGADPTGATNSVQAVKAAVATLKEGDVLEFPKGTYDLTGEPINIPVQWITVRGQAELIMNFGFRPSASHFHIDGVDGLRLICPAWSDKARGIQVDNVPVAGSPITYLEDFQVRNLYMENFFYAVAFIGGTYLVNGNEEYEGYPIRDVLIENCTSKTFTNANAGHFQSIQVENVAYINNRTYGGRNATSYNAIKGNGFIRVIGNYDHENLYGSCEIENATGKVVVSGNTFKKKIWIDDSFDVTVAGNVCDDTIHITVGSNNGDAKNVIVADNVCKNIRAEQFGEYKGGLIRFLNINGNTVKGDNVHGIWIHGNSTVIAHVANNMVTGKNTNDISIQRNEQLKAIIRGNIGNNGIFLIAGTGGKVYGFDLFNMIPNGNRDSFPASHLEREFNGLRLLGDDGVTAYRISVNPEGTLYPTKYL